VSNQDISQTNSPISATPADLLATLMKARGWKQTDLAYVLGVKDTTGISAILSGKRGFSAEMAKMLATAFGQSAEMFARAQATWELSRAADPEPGVNARARIQTEYPLRAMMKRGWFKEDNTNQELESALCRFFNVGSLSEIPHVAHAAHRTGYEEIPAPQLAWLFRVRQIAREMTTPNYDRSKLEEAIVKLAEARNEVDSVRHVPRLLREAGVRFVVVEALPGSKIDGVCLWLDAKSPVIGMSLRFDRIDNFWFVLRHECAHVLHGHGKDAAIVDAELEESFDRDVGEEERIANQEGAEFCVPQKEMKSFYLRKNPFFSETDVQAFSKRMKIHPGLAVGQLQRLAKRYDILRKHLVAVRRHLAGSMMMDGWGDVVPVET
jgi:HTH-type transcriptional regulator / antitoxin HigA